MAALAVAESQRRRLSGLELAMLRGKDFSVVAFELQLQQATAAAGFTVSDGFCPGGNLIVKLHIDRICANHKRSANMLPG